MAQTRVFIQAPGGGFNATVDIAADLIKLPRHIQGHFLAMDDLRGDLIIHADRQPHIGEPTMWFNGRKDGYHFWMNSKDSNDFTAEAMG